MALRFQPVPVLFRGGLDTKSDPRTAIAGKFLELENLYVLRTDEARSSELRKRNGSSVLVRTDQLGGALNQARSLIALPGGGLAMIADTSSAVPDASLWTWDTKHSLWVFGVGNVSPIPRAVTALSPVAAHNSITTGGGGSDDLVDPDSALANGLQLSTWVDRGAGVASAEVGVAITDITTGVTLQSPQYLGIGLSARACAGGSTYLSAFWVNNSVPGSLMVSTVNATAGAGVLPASTTLVAGGVVASQPWVDCRAKPGSNNIMVAYRANAGGISVLEYNPATNAVVTGPVNIAAADATLCLGWLEDPLATGSYFLATAGGTSGVVVRTLSAAFAVTATNVIDAAATTNVRNITGHIKASATDYTVLWDVDATPTHNMKIRQGDWSGSATVADTALAWSLASKSFKYDGLYYVIGAYDSTTQTAFALLSLSTPGVTRSPAGAIMPGNAGGRTVKNAKLSSVYASAVTGQLITALTRKTGLTASPSSTVGLRSIVRATIDLEAVRARPSELGGTLFIPGGTISAHDGATLSPATFMVFPEGPTLTGSTQPGACCTLLGEYQFVTVFRWLDATGRVIRSAPSVPISITLTGTNNAITAVCPTYRAGMSSAVAGAMPTLELYRAGPAAAGATALHKIGEVQSDPSANTVSFLDTTLDAVAEAGELLYTMGSDGTPGALEHLCPPSCSILTPHGPRLFAVNPEYGTEVIYSKEYKPGFGIGFNPLLAFRVEGGNGAVRALASMDDRLICFKSGSTHAVTGIGPDDLGNGTFNDPILVSSNVGTTNPMSVCSTPEGVMFKSAKGIYMLTRGLQVEYVGADVEAYNSLTITDATLVADQNQARYVTAEGRTLVYDYYAKTWTTFVTQTALAAVNWGGVFAYVSATGIVSYEVAGQYNDNGAAIATRLVTSHLALAGIMGFKRLSTIQLLGEFIGAHTLVAAMEFNYSGSNAQTVSIAGSAPYQFEIPIGDGLQKSEAVKLTLTESSTTGGYRLSAISLLVGMKGGQYRVAASKRMV